MRNVECVMFILELKVKSQFPIFLSFIHIFPLFTLSFTLSTIHFPLFTFSFTLLAFHFPPSLNHAPSFQLKPVPSEASNEHDDAPA